MIVSFAWPSSHYRTGGVVALYEFANGLARLGHQVNFIHAPAWPDRIDSMDQLTWFAFDPGVEHYIADDFDDPRLPAADVFSHSPAPARLGQSFAFIQGARMFPEPVERETFRLRQPKVCIARWLVNVGTRYGVPSEQLWHVPMGIDHGIFTNHTSPADRRYDLAINFNDHPTKGWPIGVDVLREVHRRRPGSRTVVFGFKPPSDDLPDGVEFHEYPTHRTLADDVYNQSRVFVQPSYHEGFGFTAVEAMACGAALVTTDNGGSEDYAIGNETAVLASPGDADGLAEGVLALLDDEDRRLRLARAGETLVRGFDWDLGAAKLAGHLEHYLADPEQFRAEPSAGELSLWS